MLTEKFREAMTKIITNVGNQGELSTITAELITDYEGVTNTVKQHEDQIKQLETDNENLRKANLALFLKIGEPPKGEKPEAKEEKELPPLDSYFDEYGNIKKGDK